MEADSSTHLILADLGQFNSNMNQADEDVRQAMQAREAIRLQGLETLVNGLRTNRLRTGHDMVDHILALGIPFLLQRERQAVASTPQMSPDQWGAMIDRLTDALSAIKESGPQEVPFFMTLTSMETSLSLRGSPEESRSHRSLETTLVAGYLRSAGSIEVPSTDPKGEEPWITVHTSRYLRFQVGLQIPQILLAPPGSSTEGFSIKLEIQDGGVHLTPLQSMHLIQWLCRPVKDRGVEEQEVQDGTYPVQLYLGQDADPQVPNNAIHTNLFWNMLIRAFECLA